jgi:hypothetical protein
MGDPSYYGRMPSLVAYFTPDPDPPYYGCGPWSDILDEISYPDSDYEDEDDIIMTPPHAPPRLIRSNQREIRQHLTYHFIDNIDTNAPIRSINIFFQSYNNNQL